MNILFAGYKNGHQITRFKEEAGKLNKNINIYGCLSTDLVLNFIEGEPNFFVKGIKKNLTDFDLVYLGISSNKTRWDWYTVCEYLNEKGVVIVNEKVVDKSYKLWLSASSDYIKQVQNNIPTPKSTIIYTKSSLKYVINNYDFPLIVKISGKGLGRKGKGVYKVNSILELKKIISDNPNAEKFTIREFIKNTGDIRVFCVGYKAIGAMKRVPKKGEFKANISQGASGEVYNLNGNKQVKDISEKLSKLTKTQVSGVDVIIDEETNKPYVLEINPNPQFIGFEEYTKTNAAKKIVEYLVSLGKLG